MSGMAPAGADRAPIESVAQEALMVTAPPELEVGRN